MTGPHGMPLGGFVRPGRPASLSPCHLRRAATPVEPPFNSSKVWGQTVAGKIGVCIGENYGGLSTGPVVRASSVEMTSLKHHLGEDKTQITPESLRGVVWWLGDTCHITAANCRSYGHPHVRGCGVFSLPCKEGCWGFSW